MRDYKSGAVRGLAEYAVALRASAAKMDMMMTLVETDASMQEFADATRQMADDTRTLAAKVEQVLHDHEAEALEASATKYIELCEAKRKSQGIGQANVVQLKKPEA